MTDETIVRSWLHGRTANTASAYEGDTRQFLAFLGKPLADATLQDIQAWHTQMTLCANDDETPTPFEFRLGHRRTKTWLCPTSMAQSKQRTLPAIR